MRTLALLAALALLPAVSHAAEQTDREKLVGKWHVTELNLAGMQVTATQLLQVPWNWDISAEKIISHRPGRGGAYIHDEELTFNFGTAGNTRTVDVIGPDNQVLKGIYVLDGNSFKICFVIDPKADRPTDFESGGKKVVMTMTRS